MGFDSLHPEYISIHAPTRGATSSDPTEKARPANFNPRSHERSDQMRQSGYACLVISIHAPTRGATTSRFASGCPGFYFNPRSHERSDTEGKALVMLVVLFQSTLPREERHGNRRHPADADEISIHAPTRGATTSDTDVLKSGYISIHAPTRGATPA